MNTKKLATLWSRTCEYKIIFNRFYSCLCMAQPSLHTRHGSYHLLGSRRDALAEI